MRIGLGKPVQITHLALDSLSTSPMWVIGADSPAVSCPTSSKMPFDASGSSGLTTNHTEMAINSTFFSGPAQGACALAILFKREYNNSHQQPPSSSHVHFSLSRPVRSFSFFCCCCFLFDRFSLQATWPRTASTSATLNPSRQLLLS